MRKLGWLILLVGGFVAVHSAPAPASDNAVVPFLNPSIDPIIHIDFSAIDLNAINAWRQKILSASPLTAAQQDAQNKLDEKSMAGARQWVADFRGAGGKDIYILVQPAGLMKGEFGGIVAPFTSASDKNALIQSFAGDPRPTAPPTTLITGNTLVYAPAPVLARMKTTPSRPRPELMDALAAGGNAPFVIAMVPAGLKTTSLGGMADLFREAQWANVNWMSLSINPPPNTAGHLMVQCRDDTAASSIAEVLRQKMRMLRDDPITRLRLGGDLDKLVDSALPRVAGAHVYMAIDQRTVDEVFMPMVMRQVQAAMGGPNAPGGRNITIQQPNAELAIASILLACQKYQAANRLWPDSLQTLAPAYLQKEVLINPRHPELNPGYVYIAPPPDVSSPRTFIVLYEAISNTDRGDIYVGFADRHIEVMKVEDLRKRLNP